VLLSAVALAGALALHANPGEHKLCSGYAACRAAGYGDFGYGRARGTSWWDMGTGANCTNFVAYRLVRAGMPNRRPLADPGRDAASLDAYRWGVVYASRTDSRPDRGAVAWWGRRHGGHRGHVAFVESVNPDGSLTISEDSSTGHGFDWKLIRPGREWPSGFIHFRLPGSRTSTPVTVSPHRRNGVQHPKRRGAHLPHGTAGSVRLRVDPPGQLIGTAEGPELDPHVRPR